MKKKIFSILAVIVLCMSCLLGCGDDFSPVKISGVQETDYIVTSNGGMSVQYGNYIYFINGTRGYDDTDGKGNIWGKVKKGGLYRAELLGAKNSRNFSVERNKDTNLEFKSTKGLDYDEEQIDIVDVQLVVPKTIGTSGYENGGVFIFDNFIYYASPNNTKNKDGVVQSAKTDFFRTKIDGKKTQLLYTTDVDTASSPYAFYKQDGFVYLVVYAGDKIVSIKMDEKKVLTKTVIAEEVTGVVFPEKTVYDSQAATNKIEDFIYFSRKVNDKDPLRAGTALEFMRPSGLERTVFSMNGKTETLESVSNGMVFYRTTINSKTAIVYNNLHDAMMSNSDGYKTEQDGLNEAQRNKQLNNTALGDVGSYTKTHAFRASEISNVTYVLGVDSTGMQMFTNGNSYQVYSGGSNFKIADGKDVYFTEGEGNILFKTNMFVSTDNKTDAEKKIQVTKTDMVASGLKVDIVADYLVYFSKVDEWADKYAFFYNLRGLEGEEALFIGERIDADIKPKECDVEGCKDETHDHSKRDGTDGDSEEEPTA